MTNINLDKSIFLSQFSGLGNYSKTTFNYTFNSQTILVNGFTSFTVSHAISNSDAVSQLIVNFNGIETVWRPISGRLSVLFPNVTAPNYSIYCQKYFTSGYINVDVTITNLSAGSIIIPTTVFDFSASLYVAPF